VFISVGGSGSIGRQSKELDEGSEHGMRGFWSPWSAGAAEKENKLSRERSWREATRDMASEMTTSAAFWAAMPAPKVASKLEGSEPPMLAWSPCC
jgi:hypothetical protein